ncbi:hypothetical protein N657DRAFT_127283 [Parathielavia appendiculata]|uniref:Uncharacterized protein n=1 Tax=Parathielavia appendiculata TaxID=2587402 RepID=A0AAN6Z0U3_9PEZI|nr:hypothetical protein N657DRAFT_127283 [Parathielavia appendiculata]
MPLMKVETDNLSVGEFVVAVLMPGSIVRLGVSSRWACTNIMKSVTSGRCLDPGCVSRQ